MHVSVHIEISILSIRNYDCINNLLSFVNTCNTGILYCGCSNRYPFPFMQNLCINIVISIVNAVATT